MVDKISLDNPGESNPDKLSIEERTRTTNREGGVAFDPWTPEFALYKVVINNLLEDSFYDSVEDAFDTVIDRYDAVADTNPEFILQLAVHARQEQGFRDIPQLLLVLAANDERVTQPDDPDSALIREYTPSIIDRTDEFNTVVSYQLRAFGKPIPSGLKKGIEDALHKAYAIVEVSYSGTSETERVTYISRDGFVDDVPSDAIARAVESVAERNNVEADQITDWEIVDAGYVHDEYTFTKYQQRDKSVSLHDVINLVRPSPRSSDNRDELFGRIAYGELDKYEDVEPLREDRTWESTRSDDEDDRSEVEQWRDRLDDMGIMSRVRNLRNMLEAGLSGREIFDYDDLGVVDDDSSLTPNADTIFGPESERIVRESKMFPFRYYQAYKACSDNMVSGGRYRSRTNTLTIDLGSGTLLDEYSKAWLEQAIDASVQNLPETIENTFTAVDLSGSMFSPVSNDSSLQCAEIGALFGAILMKRNSDTGVFATDFALVDADVDNVGVLELANRIFEVGDNVGGGTDAGQVVEWMRRNNEEYDRVVVLTDMQLWGDRMANRSGGLKSEWDNYVQLHDEDPHLYLLDLQSYGDLTMPENYHNVHQISGWDSSVVEYVDKVEQADDLITEIETVDPTDY